MTERSRGVELLDSFGSSGGDLIIVADAHIDADDAAGREFCRFLEEVGAGARAIVLLGDIFSLWIGTPGLTRKHHREVLETCQALRARGVHVSFFEGNREFSVGRWEGRAFDRVLGRDAITVWGGQRWHLAHGDLLDPTDMRHRRFRSFVRSRPVLTLFRLFPPALAHGLAHRLERSLRRANLARKRSVPRERLQRYAEWLGLQRCDAGIIGHLHVQMSLEVESNGRTRSLYVLPDWRSERRYLRIDTSGRAEFEAWGPPREALASVLSVESRGAEFLLALDRVIDAAPGDWVSVESGHGWQAPRGRVTAADTADCDRGTTLRVTLGPGDPVQAGDRVRVLPSTGDGDDGSPPAVRNGRP